MKKWEEFDSRYSGVKAGTVDKGDHNLIEDWNRLVHSGGASINGVPLVDLATSYMKQNQGGQLAFETVDDLQRFFSESLLRNVSAKDEALQFLKTALHQGGLMYPVSTPLATFSNEQVQGLQPAAQDSMVSKQVNFITTDVGFKVQEIYKAKEFRAPMDADTNDSFPSKLRDVMTEDFAIKPDDGNDFVIKAQATVDVDFSKDSSKPDITVESNTISYGSKAVKSFLDTRSLGKIIKDFLSRLFGQNKVQDISKSSANAAEDQTDGDPNRNSHRL